MTLSLWRLGKCSKVISRKALTHPTWDFGCFNFQERLLQEWDEKTEKERKLCHFMTLRSWKSFRSTGKQNVGGRNWNCMTIPTKSLRVKNTLFHDVFLHFPPASARKAVLMKIHQIFKLKPIINVYSFQWKKEKVLLSSIFSKCSERTIKTFPWVSTFFVANNFWKKQEPRFLSFCFYRPNFGKFQAWRVFGKIH